MKRSKLNLRLGRGDLSVNSLTPSEVLNLVSFCGGGNLLNGKELNLV